MRWVFSGAMLGAIWWENEINGGGPENEMRARIWREAELLFFFNRMIFFSLVVACRFSCPEVCGILVPQPGIKPMSPALEGGFLTIGPPEKSWGWVMLKAGSARRGRKWGKSIPYSTLSSFPCCEIGVITRVEVISDSEISRYKDATFIGGHMNAGSIWSPISRMLKEDPEICNTIGLGEQRSLRG